MSTALFLDFDKVLFDTERLKTQIKKAFLSVGYSDQEYTESYRAVRKIGYSPEKQIALMKRELPSPILPRDFSQYVYPDVFPFLKELRKKGVWLGLISFGDPVWQEYKVVQTGLKQEFDLIAYTSEEDNKVLPIRQAIEKHKFAHIIFVDDRREELEVVKKALPEVEIAIITREVAGNTLPDILPW